MNIMSGKCECGNIVAIIQAYHMMNVINKKILTIFAKLLITLV